MAWLDGAEVSASGWGSGGPWFQSHPRLIFQSCSRYQLNQLGSKAASESTFKKSNTCGVSNYRLYFFTLLGYFFWNIMELLILSSCDHIWGEKSYPIYSIQCVFSVCSRRPFVCSERTRSFTVWSAFFLIGFFSERISLRSVIFRTISVINKIDAAQIRVTVVITCLVFRRSRRLCPRRAWLFVRITIGTYHKHGIIVVIKPICDTISCSKKILHSIGNRRKYRILFQGLFWCI